MTEIRSTVILGSGCAGLTAAIYTARAGLQPLVLEGHEPGGQLSMTTLVENFPGWPEGIQGPELIENMKKQAARFGASFQTAHLNAAELGARPIRLTTSAGEILTRTLIVASGASARWLGLPSEQALIGHGVARCADLGGGDSDPDVDCGLRGQRALAGLAERTGADWARRLQLRHLRRLLLPRARDCGRGRRRLGDGGGALPDPLCLEGDAAAPARGLPRLEDHAGACHSPSQDRAARQHHRRGGAGRGRPRGEGAAAEGCEARKSVA